MSDDPINGTPDGYSVDKFYTHSTNTKGFSKSSRVFDLPPEIAAEIGKLIASQRIPEYRTMADFHRDAAVHRVRYLQSALDDPDFHRAANNFLVAAELEDLAKFMAAKVKSLDDLRKAAQDVRSPADQQVLNSRINLAISQTDDPYYQDQYRQFLR